VATRSQGALVMSTDMLRRLTNRRFIIIISQIYTQRLYISTADSTAHAYSEKDRNNYSWH